MPIRWKIFAFINYLIVLIYLVLLVWGIRFLQQQDDLSKETGKFGFYMLMASFFIIILNCVFNIYIIHKRFPNEPLSASGTGLHNTMTAFFVLAVITKMIILVLGMRESLEYPVETDLYYFELGALIFTICMGTYILLNQLQVKKKIKANYHHKIAAEIGNIGD